MKKAKSEILAAKFEAIKSELEAAQRAESEAADRELIRLCHKANCRDEAIKFAQRLIDQERRKRGADRTADQVPGE